MSSGEGYIRDKIENRDSYYDGANLGLWSVFCFKLNNLATSVIKTQWTGARFALL